nr:Flavin reductase like domain protein [uncultured bacterium]
MSKSKFKEAMSHLATGVSILTCSEGSNHFGMTISSLSSVGLNPPTVSICVEGQSRMLEVMRRTRCFGVTVLSVDQQAVGMQFSNPQIPYADRFKDLDFEVINGCPLIKAGLAMMTCEIVLEHTISENVVIFGRTTHVEAHHGKPLVYFHRDWQKLALT